MATGHRARRDAHHGQRRRTADESDQRYARDERDGTVYAATTTGPASSRDHGNSWQYIRGKDPSDKVRNSKLETSPNLTSTLAPLCEDYCTCIAAAGSQAVLVGHREFGIDQMNVATDSQVSAREYQFSQALICSSGNRRRVMIEGTLWPHLYWLGGKNG